MPDEIINRVTSSKLQVIDLEDFYPEGARISFDIKDWLAEGLVLREKAFRAYIAEHNWAQYKDCYLALGCSTDAIVPDWAYMLISIQLQPYAKFVINGDLEQLETVLYNTILNDLNIESYTDLPIIIKGCSNKPVPLNALILLTNKLKPVAKSIMYGEACSAVPLFKKK